MPVWLVISPMRLPRSAAKFDCASISRPVRVSPVRPCVLSPAVDYPTAAATLVATGARSGVSAGRCFGCTEFASSTT